MTHTLPLRALVLAAALALALAFVSACSDDDGEISVEQACADVARALCDKVTGCAPLTLETTFGTIGACVDVGKASCMAAIGAPDIDPGITGRAAACADAIDALGCDLDTVSPDFACEMPPGTRADGSSCAVGLQCQSSYCKGATTEECGVCAVKAKSGEDCTEEDGCETGLRCNIAGKCYAPVGEAGGDCSTAMKCAGTLVCSQGVCVAPIGEGADCGAQEPPCDSMKGLYCETSTGKCTQIEVAKAGESCGLKTACAAGSSCFGGKCTADAEAGKTCDEVDGPSCKYGLECVKGTCKTPSIPVCL